MNKNNRLKCGKNRQFLPGNMFIPLLWTLTWNTLVYGGARTIASRWYHYDMTTGLDRMIPVLPWTTLIYVVCYLFWGINYIFSVRGDEEAAWRMLGADFLGKSVCLVLFLLIPTTNVRPVLEGNGFWEIALRIVYQADAADNLFPSIHCLVSWLSFLGIRGKKGIPVWYQRFSCVFALMVFVSTLTTKQHVFADVVAGYLLAEGCYWISGHTSFTFYYRKIFIWINQQLYRKGYSLEQ